MTGKGNSKRAAKGSLYTTTNKRPSNHMRYVIAVGSTTLRQLYATALKKAKRSPKGNSVDEYYNYVRTIGGGRHVVRVDAVVLTRVPGMKRAEQCDSARVRANGAMRTMPLLQVSSTIGW